MHLRPKKAKNMHYENSYNPMSNNIIKENKCIYEHPQYCDTVITIHRVYEVSLDKCIKVRMYWFNIYN